MEPKKSYSSKGPIMAVGILLVITFVGIIGVGYWMFKSLEWPDGPKDRDIAEYKWDKDHDIKTFDSEEDFLSYLEAADQIYSQASGIDTFGLGALEDSEVMVEFSADGETTAAPDSALKTTSERSSETNVQVQGVDEPDIVKTDGQNLFVSSLETRFYADEVRCFGEGCFQPQNTSVEKTSIINALPVTEMGIKSDIENGGELLLEGSTLIILGREKIEAYDISDSVNPDKLWTHTFDGESYLHTSRLTNGNLYLVLRTFISRDDPCPLPMLEGDTGDTKIMCNDIYHPSIPIPTDSTYTVLKINTDSGDVDDEISFVGSSGNSVVYMSAENLYVTYSYNENSYEFVQEALGEVGKDIFPEDVITKIEKVNGYDISEQAKHAELEFILQSYFDSLNSSKLDNVRNDLNNSMTDYVQEHAREMSSTGIVKLDLNNLNISANKVVPGYPLNQFSLDEYQGNLRIATTIEPNVYYYGIGMNINSRDLSVNDVYVLDSSLDKIGEVTDLGKEERIYSVRYIQDKGYVVTFRETDPFYVLDLSDPNDPKMKGELKIPGYSAYLHPISDTIILGIGREDGRVKMSLFDVSNASDPQEVDKFTLNDYWTDVEGNHHAFLLDDKHEVFFMPAGSSGHVFSYSGNKLEKVKTIQDMNAKRALYINDNLYVVGDYSIRVFDETNWETLEEFEYQDQPKGSYTDPIETPIGIDSTVPGE